LKKGLGIVFLKILKFWNILGEATMKRLKKIVYGPEDLTDEDIATFFSLFNIQPEMAINYFKPEKMVTYLNPEDRLNGLDPETIEAYLNKIKKQ
jgi:cytochrome c oxidase assembly protein Cox11